MTCEACGDPIATERSYGRFHWRCVERLLAEMGRPVAVNTRSGRS